MSYLRYLCFFVLFVFVLCARCCQFLWSVHFGFALSVFSNVYIHPSLVQALPYSDVAN